MEVEKNLKSAIIERKDFKARQPMKKNKKVIYYGWIYKFKDIRNILTWMMSNTLQIYCTAIHKYKKAYSHNSSKKIRITIEEVSR